MKIQILCMLYNFGSNNFVCTTGCTKESETVYLIVKSNVNKMSKKSQKTNPKAEMSNNLVYMFMLVPNIFILNIFGMIITFSCATENIIVLHIDISYAVLFTIEDHLQSNVFFNVVALCLLLTHWARAKAWEFIQWETAAVHTHTHQRDYGACVMNVMAWHYASTGVTVRTTKITMSTSSDTLSKKRTIQILKLCLVWY